jgi:putative transcriptional regulator
MRLWLALAALVVPATLFAAAPPNSPVTPGRQSLAGQFLIASPGMGDPRFQQTVVLMVRHNQDGAMGIVINRPLGERPLARLLEALGETGGSAAGAVTVFGGGPVERQRGFVLHSADYRGSGTLDINGHVALTASVDIFRDIAGGLGPRKSLIAFGYAGWGPGQLEGELAHNAWFTAPIDLKLVFDEDRDKVWERAMERRTRDL